ncbi:MAG: hypothetical protein LQ345_004562 [Seirophora villosa]|nr:MAG: hypothetical protein LQ345_004562 [Seirophora villosa]
MAFGTPKTAGPSHIALDLLKEVHSPETALSIFTEKVLHKPLHLRPTSPDPNSQDARARRRLQRVRKQEKSRRRQRPKPLSAKEKRITGIYEIPKESQKYHIYVPLYRMWLGYMWEILGMVKGKQNWVTAQGAGGKFASADFHGSKLIVVRSKCVSLVGLKGIVVRDTRFTFQIITEKNELKSIPKPFAFAKSRAHNDLAIPKNHTIFEFHVPQPDLIADSSDAMSDKDISDEDMGANALVFQIHGSSFKHRAVERATKKFKQRPLPEL